MRNTTVITAGNGGINGIFSVSIEGIPKEFSILSAVLNSIGNPTVTYQWYRNETSTTSGGTAIVGETNSTYTTITADVGKYIYVIVTPIGETQGSVVSAVSTQIDDEPSTLTGATISGSGTTYNSMLTCTPAFDHSSGTVTYQWKRDNSNISGATNSTYTTVVADNGNTITCVVTPSGITEGSAVTSNEIDINFTITLSAATITSPNLTVGVVATCTPSFTPTELTGTVTYQWKLNNSNISGATNSTYTTTKPGVLTCVVTPTAPTQGSIITTSSLIIKPQYVTIGVQIDQSNTNSESAVTYIDENGTAISNSVAKNLIDTILENVKVGNLSNSGTEFNILPDDGTGASLGSTHDYVTRIPKLGLKIVNSTNNYIVSDDNAANNAVVRVFVTNDPNATAKGFSYNAHTYYNDGDSDFIYISNFLNATITIDSTLLAASFSGVIPDSGISLTKAETYTRNKGSKYRLISYFAIILLQALFVIIFKTINCQAALGRGYVDNKSSSRPVTGATVGVSGITGTPNPSFAPNTSRTGLFYGEIAVNSSTSQKPVKFLGIEDFWGNMYYFVGALSSGNQSIGIGKGNYMYSTTAGNYTYKYSTNFNLCHGYQKNCAGNTSFGFAPVSTSYASGSTCYADISTFQNNKFPVFGGAYDSADVGGIFRLSFTVESSTSAQYIGYRFMYYG